ncbi:molybdate ABC transporter substrate-binding protein [Salicibibacter kimchii]|uniref:Molybdate ABC transporter substrate-binding protein n=1 Tax=Salicibibacter kimchii TaxID=2099786 RepID=A0A345C164_9BACI|nr:molybdate ABC transporter substrate-binding protein [Salicibibacter kimchii]AXF56945.1 molybdate ABC transporter substrate-binding protein [Salicibibacter kimchii]
MNKFLPSPRSLRRPKASLYIFIMVFLTACSSTQDDDTIEIHVAAASSMQDALRDLEKEIENDTENIDVVFQFGGSGSLQRQIEQGAPFDIFLSASEADFNALVEANKIKADQSEYLLTNDLALIQPAHTETPISAVEDLQKNNIDTIAIGTSESVPAGAFAKETLENMHVWGELEDKIVQARSVRQVLTYNEENSVDAGFVFVTDAVSSDQVEIVENVDPSLHTDILYSIGIVRDMEHTEEALEVYDYLVSDEAKDVYESYGYGGLEE